MSKLFSSLGFRPINAAPEERPAGEAESPADDAPAAPAERASGAAAAPANDDEKEEKKEEDEDEEMEESEPPTPRKGGFGRKRRASSDLDSTPKKRVPAGAARIIP
ncbi:uncharacterized protein THITE_2122846 [Thermothielavioides terrestris NRRL 8126]|uniref:Uncharacterized protein n=1 Tax=Thermothielavioides terrestris (strain ATCC 38088 / NRRL 8126) TaxID=578455 RepID=G2QYC5_THETT|nr:uncharacterized protein THITE_2107661 [Thermothielavioides terrestris NRRL 8126]XP_003652559.1 uncharacterized protein THITE_2114187 [Thermothielavioides terrestris NRRL 8126]XP_003653882.1 uncharacterized protein THITE_2116438 [Thermothielavioides terrestris NRRL 8126]XP_003657032.1 uncharacterized protein THITE_2122386 [Thermothielavioides terrestris NRRL 8126]XP_003657282.1 uncharacterized protein THITE_2122846 [Thermothielavioides terrestris NRRL 8126]AEO62887.1 hypothetical protein THI